MVVAADRVETSLRDQGSGTNSTGTRLKISHRLFAARCVAMAVAPARVIVQNRRCSSVACGWRLRRPITALGQSTNFFQNNGLS